MTKSGVKTGKRTRTGQFKLGNNAGAKGRPKKGDSLTDLLRKQGHLIYKDGVTYRDAMIKAIYKKAVKGEIKACEMVIDRLEGKSIQTTNISSRNITEVRVIE